MDEPSVQKRRLEPGTSSASSSGISSVSSSLPIDQQQQQQQLPAPELAQQQQPQGQMWPPPQTSAPVVPKKKRFCQFCRNHQISKPTKGHKKVCLYRFCVCTKCKNTRERHIVMAKQVAIKREKESAAHRQKDDTDVFPENIPNLVPPDTTQVNSGAAHPGSPQRILWERILTVLMEKGYRIDTYPLLHIIFKEVTSDLPVLYQKIAESLLELQNIKPLIVAEMTQLEPVAAAQSAGVPVLDYQYWLDGFDLKALRVHHYELYTKSYHEQLRHGGSPLWKHNPFPATAEIPFDFMSQGWWMQGWSWRNDQSGEFNSWSAGGLYSPRNAGRH